MRPRHITRTKHLTRLLFLFFVFLPCFLFAQTSDSTTRGGEKDYAKLIPQKDGVFMYEVIQNVDSTTKDALYNNARAWFVQTFKSAKDVLQMDDRQAGRLIGKGLFTFDYKYVLSTLSMQVYFTVDITVKDGKYRLQIYDIDPHDESVFTKGTYDKLPLKRIVDESVTGNDKKANRRRLDNINTGFVSMLESAKDALSKKMIATSSDF